MAQDFAEHLANNNKMAVFVESEQKITFFGNIIEDTNNDHLKEYIHIVF